MVLVENDITSVQTIILSNFKKLVYKIKWNLSRTNTVDWWSKAKVYAFLKDVQALWVLAQWASRKKQTEGVGVQEMLLENMLQGQAGIDVNVKIHKLLP